MNKKEAAEFLGVSDRAVERYKAAGKISARTMRVRGADGKPRPTLDFDRADLERFKADLNVETFHAVAVDELPSDDTNRQTDMSGDDAPASDALTVTDTAFIAVQSALAESARRPSDAATLAATSPLSDTLGQVAATFKIQRLSTQLAFDLKDAAFFSGFPENYLRVAIREQRLIAKKRGRNFIIKRADLIQFVTED